MKKFLASLMAISMILSLVACGTDDVNSGDTSSENNNSVVVDESKPEPAETPVIEPTPTPEKEIPVLHVDYENVPFGDWMYSDYEGSEDFKMLSIVNTVPYGTAGSSLDFASAAVIVLDFTNKDNSIDVIRAFMENMTDTQKDYFSFSWDGVSSYAAEFFADIDNMMPLLGSIGQEDFDINHYSIEKLNALDKEVNELFEEMGVQREWKNHKDLEPFWGYNE